MGSHHEKIEAKKGKSELEVSWMGIAYKKRKGDKLRRSKELPSMEDLQLLVSSVMPVSATTQQPCLFTSVRS
jgi:hypothetical protein